jgi:hypothetical protein
MLLKVAIFYACNGRTRIDAHGENVHMEQFRDAITQKTYVIDQGFPRK